jgi:inner membrane protein
MDPITQGALGAVAATAMAPSDRLRPAAVLGWVGGMLADADIFIRSASDPLLNLEYHRHFTHALIFIPVGGLICAALLHGFVRRRLGFGQTYLYSTAGYATAGLLDACTSYGTQLLWPFSDLRVSWNLISVVDPLYTAPLLALLALSCLRRRTAWARGAAVFSVAYLLLGVIQRERASAVQRELAMERGHAAITQATVKPSIGNLLLWRSVYAHEGDYYVDAIRLGFAGPSVIYTGSQVTRFDLDAELAALPPDSVLADDLRRFAHFSDDYLAELPGREGFITDLRYSPLPHTIEPLWGIDLAGREVHEHVAFVETRMGADGDDYGRTLWTMLQRKPLPSAADPDAR